MIIIVIIIIIIFILFILIALNTLNPEGEKIKQLCKKIKIYWCVSLCFGRPIGVKLSHVEWGQKSAAHLHKFA